MVKSGSSSSVTASSSETAWSWSSWLVGAWSPTGLSGRVFGPDVVGVLVFVCVGVLSWVLFGVFAGVPGVLFPGVSAAGVGAPPLAALSVTTSSADWSVAAPGATGSERLT